MENKSFVTTVRERCRVCYTCVRECPAKAIRIIDGQAEIMGERCINCGNCVKVCSQEAKNVVSTKNVMMELLASGADVAACVAPSFPADFSDIDPAYFIGMLRKLGFKYVNEVGFGADLVADRYKRLLKMGTGKRYIAANCPAVVAYIEKYHPELIDQISPVVSPMIATSRALKKLHSPELKIVFIGPCIAKKHEAVSEAVKGEIDVAITFVELRRVFAESNISSKDVEPSDFDPPYAGMGSLFPISRGLLQAAEIAEDLIEGKVVATEGRSNFVTAIKEFGTGDLDADLLEVLCCNGCIMGPGMSTLEPHFSRRSNVGKYTRDFISKRDKEAWQAAMDSFNNLDLTREYTENDQRIPAPSDEDITKILAQMMKFAPHDELNCGACGYETCVDHAIAIYRGLAEVEMCLPYNIEKLNKTVKELAVSNEQLTITKEALIHSEKLANMGQLAAGIAHEVNNPLGVILMYAHILLDEYGNDPRFCKDLALIAEQADRCKKIVSGLLGFARQQKVTLEPSDMRDLIDRSMLSLTEPENVEVKYEYETNNTVAEVDRDQIIQVLTNLIKNAFDAMPEGGTLTVTIGGDENKIRISISDTGFGIPKENIDKVFEPFFSTKQIGKGTGMGLAVTYGIIKMHYGDIKVKSNSEPENGPTGTSFIVILPRKGKTA